MLLVFIAAVIGGVFTVDVYTPHGFSIHFLYALGILAAAISRSESLAPIVAVIVSVLTLVGLYASSPIPGLPAWMPPLNRVFTILLVWILVWLARKRHQAEAALHTANEDLEHKVASRTEELRSAAHALEAEISEHRQAEAALRLSEGRLAGILDIAEDAIIVMDHTRSIVLFNQGAARLFGYEPRDILGHPIDRLLPARFREQHGHHVDAFARAPEQARRMAQRREVFGLRKDGSEFHAEASISKLEIGNHVTFTVIVRDITDRLRTEQQLRSLTAELITVQEEERRRIARELHDDINQRLALLSIDLAEMESASVTTTHESGSIVRSLGQRLAAISDDVRHMAYRFHPSILEDLGLPTALRQMADDWSARTGIKLVTVLEEIVDPLPPHVASCLYRIVQESLTNVMKHAQATRVEIELTCDGQEVTLSVQDDGIGFTLDERQDARHGLGLVNIRERVRFLHGRFGIRSEPGRGTDITVQIPFPGAPHEETTSPLGG